LDEVIEVRQMPMTREFPKESVANRELGGIWGKSESNRCVNPLSGRLRPIFVVNP